MNIQLVGEEHTITNQDRQMVEEHFRPQMKKLFGDFADDLLHVRLKIGEKNSHGYIVSSHVTLPKKRDIYAESEHDQLLSALVEVSKEMKKQMHTESSDYSRETIRKM
jgi:ribosome-associated translation inhibitor RaiA